MKNLWSNCFDFLSTDEAKRHLKQSLIVPMGNILYQEMYFYVWLICFYHIFLIVLVLFLVVMLLRQHYALSTLLKVVNTTILFVPSDIPPI